MHTHLRILNNLDGEFKELDKKFAQEELRIFGKSTERIFKELDVTRRKQIELAAEHIALDMTVDIPQLNAHTANADETYRKMVEQLTEKEASLKALTRKLNDLSESLNQFRAISEQADLQDTTAFFS
ncbi:uncharacterized protein BYT42DRAFT_566716 [Radiomyces spectabilis]|uniref:uncharacterized protein n=1 Tax=Radiomyces spectabilis TaxID=64574 RepID=UPI00221FAC85|nr:uncharacterized protein BYT42DRAFT_566716 [Radiomyces spectabilis]KAI8381493.1 hypothetical protein BYT42DRAFT_566716 [Radiomyces spectabilis]